MCKGLAGLAGGMKGRLSAEVETRAYWGRLQTEGWKYRHGSKESGGDTAEEVGLRVLAAINDIADCLQIACTIAFRLDPMWSRLHSWPSHTLWDWRSTWLARLC